MDNLEEFHHQFLADVQRDADADGIYAAEAFFEIICGLLSEAGEIDGGTQAYHSGKGIGVKNSRTSIQVDGYGGNPRDSGTLSLLICDFSVTSEVRSSASAELKPFFAKLVGFLRASRDVNFRDAIEGTSDGFGLADLISTTWKHVEKIKLILVTNADSRAKVDAFPAGTIDDVPITYNVWDLKRIRKFMEQGQAREDLLIDFEKEFGGPIPILRASGGDAALESYLAVIPGSQLAAIYEKWGSRLLESNVRSFLQAKGNVNKGIRKTIIEEPHMFLAYNNGIAATADALDIRTTQDGLVMASVENLQIVNGGQTTASIHAVRKIAADQLPEVFVQMKLNIVPQELSEAVVPRISEYANSQNKVNAADFFANHPFHVRMEGFSRRLLAPAGIHGYRETKWFYERARGQYADEKSKLTEPGKKKWDAEFPRAQFFTKTDLAKYENSFQCKPEIVSFGAQKNFGKFAEQIGSRWGKEGAVYDEIWFRRLIAKAIIFRRIEKAVSAADWYEGGYRANIITYGIAKLVHDVAARERVIDFDRLWKMQDLPSDLKRSFLVACAEAQSVILSPQAVRNIGEWAKKQACWKILSDRKLEYDDNLEDWLASQEEVNAIKREDRQDRDLDKRVAEQSRVFELGASFWLECHTWGRQMKALSPREAGILDTCSRIPDKIPTERQCELAMRALDKLVGLGFIHEALEVPEH